jgi:hypothetical protein
LLLCLWLAACSISEQSPKALQEEAVRVLALGGDEQAHEKSAEALLDQALSQDPRHVPSLVTRAALRIRRHDYSGALADNDTAIGIRGQTPALSMMRCMLRDRLGTASPTACYRQVVLLHERDARPCQEVLNCVVAALMANVPDAQANRDHFLALPRSGPDQAVAEGLLRGFNRERYLRSVLP